MDHSTTIVIRGQSALAFHVAFPIMNATHMCEAHVDATRKFAEAADEQVRTLQVATCLSGNTGKALGEKIVGLIEVGNGYAVDLGIQLCNAIFRTHNQFWEDYQDQRRGKSVVMATAEVMEARRGLLEERLTAAEEAAEAVKFHLDSLDCADERRLAGELFYSIVEGAVKEAQSSVTFALGKYQVTVSDEQLKATVDEAINYFVQVGGMTQEAAEAKITEVLGATDEDRKAKMVAAEQAALMLDSQGTKDGALLAAGNELDIIEQGVQLLTDFISNPLPVYETPAVETPEAAAEATSEAAEATSEAAAETPTEAVPPAASQAADPAPPAAADSEAPKGE